MQVKTYRAKSLQEALRWIRTDLGPHAAVLHTREVSTGWLGWIHGRQLEVTAGVGVAVPSRFPPPEPVEPTTSSTDRPDIDTPDIDLSDNVVATIPPAEEHDFRSQYRLDLGQQSSDLPSLVEELSRRTSNDSLGPAASDGLRQLLAELLAVDMDEATARDLVDRLRRRTVAGRGDDPRILQARLARLVEECIDCSGPLQLAPGKRRIVALVGPTGVGKTTTIAKLAAAFQLREQRRVGLITLDTYRVAAVDQLRTYADIIDLPMEVVTTPREARGALAKLADRELLLVDTSGHSPGDVARMQELQSLLIEIQADEVQLVLSSVASVSSLRQATARFATLGATGLVLTKLDESTVMGHLMSYLRDCRLPISYVTYGQNVPDDIAPAHARQLARQILGLDGGR